MSKLILKDLVESVELDTAAMTHVRGGLTVNNTNSQQANQQFNNLNIGGSFTNTSNPTIQNSLVLTETAPVTNVTLGSFSFPPSFNNVISV